MAIVRSLYLVLRPPPSAESGFPRHPLHGDTQWYFSTTFPSLPSDTDHASRSSAILFSNHNLSTQGAWHFVDAYLENSFSGSSLTDGLPNRATTESSVSPRSMELKACWHCVRIYMQVARYKNTTARTPPTVIVTQLNRIRFPALLWSACWDFGSTKLLCNGLSHGGFRRYIQRRKSAPLINS
jgi:hypothetical protein